MTDPRDKMYPGSACSHSYGSTNPLKWANMNPRKQVETKPVLNDVPDPCPFCQHLPKLSESNQVEFGGHVRYWAHVQCSCRAHPCVSANVSSEWGKNAEDAKKEVTRLWNDRTLGF